MKNDTSFETSNPNAHAPDAQQGDETPVKVSADQSPRDGGVIFDLGSCSETELMELKEKFIKDAQRIRSLIKQIEARELKLDQEEQEEKNKRTMAVTPDREKKRKRLELNSTEMRKCGVILDKLMKHRHGWVFNKPVDVVALKLPDYYQIVKRPMDLGTVKLKLGKCVYGNPVDFAKDVRLTFNNALLYNREGEVVHTMATVLLDMFDKLFDSAYEKHQSVIVEQHKEVSVTKKARSVAEWNETPRMRKEMSVLERDQLGTVLLELAEEHLNEILQIIGKRNSRMTTPDEEGEIELDVQALDSETLWDLHSFARLKLKG